LIYEIHEEHLNAPVRSIRMGLDRGEKCIYIADENTAGEVIKSLRAVGIDVDAAVKSGILTVANKPGTYLRQGHFEPDEMNGSLGEAAPIPGRLGERGSGSPPRGPRPSRTLSAEPTLG
jgi:hypothetical protein